MARSPVIHRHPAWDAARRAFRASGREKAPWAAALDEADAPDAIVELMAATDRWTAEVISGFDRFPRRRLSGRIQLAGRLVADGLHLRAALDTAAVADWLGDPSTPGTAAAAFVDRRRSFTDRLADLADLGADAFRDAGFALPSEVGRRAWYENARRLAQLFGGRHVGRIELGVAGVLVGLGSVAVRERRVAYGALGRHLRGGRLGERGRRRVDAANRRLAGRVHLDHRRAEHLRAAHRAVRKAGAGRRQAERLVDAALVSGVGASGKPWQGLAVLRELIVHARLDPTATDFEPRLRAALAEPIRYTHTPGREWLVREYSIARELLKADGRSSRTTADIAVSQAGASIMPGVLANNPAMLGLAAHYMRPIQVYLDGMVAQSGADHRRHRSVFNDFFRKGAVLDQVSVIEATIDDLLSDVEERARADGGRFDFMADLAARFPIRIICAFMGIPPEDAPQVQRWALDSVRSLDAGAGLSLELLSAGNRSAAAFLDYLADQVRRARAGEPMPGIIGSVADTAELSDRELLANLAGITFAGFETTTGLLSLGFDELLRRREQWDHLRDALVEGPEISVLGELVTDRDLRWFVWAEDERNGRLADPAHIERYHLLRATLQRSDALADRLTAVRAQEGALDRAVQELLRWTAPGSVIPLTLDDDFTLLSPIDTAISGVPVAAGEPISFARGQSITVDVAAANRSGCPFGPGRFERAHGEFDVSRTNNAKHLSFGVTHVCLGAELAVENAKRLIEAVLRRMPDLHVDGRPGDGGGSLFIGLDSLPVRSERLATG